jgi:hypothetical protein
MRSHMDKLVTRVFDAEKLLQKAASATKMETLAVVMEEQRLRLDSVILGKRFMTITLLHGRLRGGRNVAMALYTD